ncbi:MAG TPA: AAA family ATPase [Syntrophobacteria bacterium]|nr:AAA family ATPase [Syntrophobacteria bacterium]
MYLDYFNLTESPFQTSADPKFLWVGKPHQHVLSALENSLLENQGVFVVTGDIGTGKTALIHAFVKSLGSKTFRAILSYPRVGKLEFFNFLAGSFHFPIRFDTEAEFFRYFTSFLRIACKFSYRVILIIDEADKLSDDIFDQILYFTNFEMLEEVKMLAYYIRKYKKPINIYLVGRTDLNEILRRKKFTILKHKLSHHLHLRPLTESETAQYIAHRLQVAGVTGTLFTKTATHMVFLYSRGYPRVINTLCGNALLHAHAKKRKRIEARLVEECAHHLGYRL